MIIIYMLDVLIRWMIFEMNFQVCREMKVKVIVSEDLPDGCK